MRRLSPSILRSKRLKAGEGSTGSQTVIFYGSEEVTNGDFATGDLTGWSGTNWGYSGGAALHTAGATSSLNQNAGLTIGINYHTSFTIAGRTAGTLKIAVGSGAAGTTRSTNGLFTENVVCAGNSSVFLIPSSDFDGTVDSISVKPVITRT